MEKKIEIDLDLARKLHCLKEMMSNKLNNSLCQNK